MTICVPRKPFVILGRGLFYVMLFSWIPITCVLVYYANYFVKWDIMLLAIPFCTCQLVFSSWWISDLNQRHQWIKWCENKPINTSSKESGSQ